MFVVVDFYIRLILKKYDGRAVVFSSFSSPVKYYYC